RPSDETEPSPILVARASEAGSRGGSGSSSTSFISRVSVTESASFSRGRTRISPIAAACASSSTWSRKSSRARRRCARLPAPLREAMGRRKARTRLLLDGERHGLLRYARRLFYDGAPQGWWARLDKRGYPPTPGWVLG